MSNVHSQIRVDFQLKNSTLKTQFKSENDIASVKSKAKEKDGGRLKSFDLRNKLISKVKTVQEQELERQKNRVQKCKAGSILGSALDHSKQRSPSVNSISSDDSILSDKNPTKKKKRKKDSDSSDERGATVKGKDTNSEISIRRINVHCDGGNYVVASCDAITLENFLLESGKF